MVPGTEAASDYDLELGERWVRERNSELIQLLIAHHPINTYDFDGVVYMNDSVRGVYPGPHDLIVTGRSFEEGDKVKDRLLKRNIHNKVFFNPIRWGDRNRASSGRHKARILKELLAAGFKIGCHFEDDEEQIEQIKLFVPEVAIVHLVHDLTPKDFRIKQQLRQEGKWS